MDQKPFGDVGGVAVAEPPSLEHTVRREGSYAAGHEKPLDAIGPGEYSIPVHQSVRKDIEEQMMSNGHDTADYWATHTKEVAKALKVEPIGVSTTLYDVIQTLSLGRVDLYERAALRSMTRLRRQSASIQADIDTLQTRIEGNVEYIPLANADEATLDNQKRIRESDKGWRYRLSETRDRARVLGLQ